MSDKTYVLSLSADTFNAFKMDFDSALQRLLQKMDRLQSDSASTAGKSIGSGIAIGIAAGGGAIGMGLAVAKSADGISRQPEAESKIRTTLMLGLVFIETAIIYALLVVILLIFVL